MSSEGSVMSTGSRIRQFGLYRTIDARTNEFLKSSRKRQIRQGCACAAISTAITVTVVVSVILVYEYSINTEVKENKKSLRPQWLGLINESDITKVDAKFTKKMNFDRTTLKLLPVLLKALNKNRYLEKIIEDYASSSPPSEVRDETDSYFKRNIFSDAKNWLKMPSSKLYTLDYKTTPLIYIKPPSQRLDYLSRVRKIRNYERMLNYFDRMINDKVTSYKHSQELKKSLDQTENPLKFNNHHKLINNTKKIINMAIDQLLIKKQNSTKNKTKIKLTNTTKLITKLTTKLPNISKPPSKGSKRNEDKQSKKVGKDCTCPSNMGKILNKLILSLQELVPQMANKKHGCGSKKKQKSYQNTHQSSTPQSLGSTSVKPTTNRILTEATMLKTTIKLTTDIPVLQNHRLTVSKETAMSPFELMKAYMSGKITTQASLFPKTNTETKNPTYTSTSTFNSGKIEFSTEGQSQFDISSTSTISDIKEYNQYVEDSKLITTDKPEQQNYYVKNDSLPIIINSTTTHKQYSDTDKYILKLPTSTIDSLINYENYETKFSREEPSSINHQTTPLDIAGSETQRTTTELIVPFKFNDPYIEHSSSTEGMLDSVAIVPNLRHPIIPLFREDDYEDYFISTTKGASDFDLTGLELIKNKVISSKPINIENNKFKNSMKKGVIKSKSNYHPVIKNKDVDVLNMRKMANLVYLPSPVDEEDESSKIANSTDKNILIRNSPERSEKNTKSGLTAVIKITTPLPITHGSDQGNNENLGEEDFQEEWIKQADNIELPFNKSGIIFVDDDNSATGSYDVDRTKSEDKIISDSIKSMLPPIRPVYLEVGRNNNDWKPEDHTDYDMNLASNFFDLPNI